MNIEFKKLEMRNFLSYGHAEIDLQDRGYCLVKGRNNCPLDNAVSNGSGKSSWISAICWALTGFTVQGITSGIKNIYSAEDDCYVKLDFIADGVEYSITRAKEPSVNLKIVRDGIDISGKGVKESSIILAQQLPDLNRKLLTSVILLGQGLPNKFTDNTPSGRKEVLEELSKSDFMIEDIKERLSTRNSSLSNIKREKEDSILKMETSKASFESQLRQLCEELEEESKPRDFDSESIALNTSISTMASTIGICESTISELEKIIDSCTDSISSCGKDYQDGIDSENESYSKAKESIDNKSNSIKVSAATLEAEIKRVESIKDVCPTCGQKIPHEEIRDLTKEKGELQRLTNVSNELSAKAKTLSDAHRDNLMRLRESYESTVSEYRKSLGEAKAKKDASYSMMMSAQTQLSSLKVALTKIEEAKSAHLSRLSSLNAKIECAKDTLGKLAIDLEESQRELGELSQRLAILKQMDTLVKRDFRGYLLTDVIAFIASRAKEYGKLVFGSENIDFKLNGNDIDIEYCGKDFSSLSGGEQQKVNLIMQFAIRDMMGTYLGFSSNILCLDEIFDNLDANGVKNVIELISTHFNDIGSVFIISHHADELGFPYDNEIEITKDVNGISSITKQ